MMAAITMQDILDAVSDALGFGLSCPADGTHQGDLVRRWVAEGLREFYLPPAVTLPRLPGYVHTWSFLRPVANILVGPGITRDTTLWMPCTINKTGTSGSDSILTASHGVFTSDDVGKTLYTDADSAEILSVTSSTVVVCEGTIEPTDDSFRIGNDTPMQFVDEDDATVTPCRPYMLGKTLNIDTDATDDEAYLGATVVRYISSACVVVEGDWSAYTAPGWVYLDMEGAYSLPDDFGWLDGEVIYSGGPLPISAADYEVTEVTTTAFGQIKIVGESEIRYYRSLSESSGTPAFAAVLPGTYDPTDPGATTNWLMLYPEPDSLMQISYRYGLAPGSLADTSLEYPYGSSQYGSVILASCLAAAERESAGGVPGARTATYLSKLYSAVCMDMNKTIPDVFGVRADTVDRDDLRRSVVRPY